MKVSVVIINYNYAEFLKSAIDSALNQTHPNVETIVVDDGSTDHSTDIIDSYGNNLKKVYQRNKGMIEASNAGFAISNGDIIIFLDADDYLKINAAEKVVSIWNNELSKVHYRLKKIDNQGQVIGYSPALSKKLSEGHVWKEIVNCGKYYSPPTSGNAFSRRALIELFPIQNTTFGDGNSYMNKFPTDAYLKRKIPFFGPVKAIDEALGIYRIHGENKGAVISQFCNKQKRQRMMNLAENDSIFIEKKIRFEEHNWDNKNLFRDGNLMKLRMLSLRFDGEAHLWKEDKKYILIKYYFTQLITNNCLHSRSHILHFITLLIYSIAPERIICMLSRIFKK